ncbi:MAG: DUF3530 family protein [Pseudomonadota bacterium]|nr:DUF3530 family protein [Pseudomonadota bacterium]
MTSLPSVLFVLSLISMLPTTYVYAEDDASAPGSTETSDDAEQAPAPVTPMRATPYPASERHQSLIEHMTLFQRAEEVVTLIADGNGAADSFYGLFLRERSGNPQGGALILHDLGQHAHWPELVAPLREGLTESGWTTLAIELPSPPADRLPIRQPQQEVPSSAETEENDQADAPESPSEESQEEPSNTSLEEQETNEVAGTTEETTGLSVEEQRQMYTGSMTARINSGLSYLASRGQLNNVIIAHGDAAVWAAGIVQARQRETENANGMVLIMVDAREHPLSPLRLNQIFDTLEIPVLDILTADARSTEWQDQQRLGAMKRKHRSGYQQIRLSSASADSVTVLRRIRGWLKTNAAGTELP